MNIVKVIIVINIVSYESYGNIYIVRAIIII